MISIIVPVYNVEFFLPQCIDSIRQQSYQEWELLLVNDGSLDESGIICDSYAQIDNRIRVFHKENGGVSSARNRGIKEANGEWITFVDSDDFVGELYLQGLAAPLLEGNQVDFVHGGCTNYENGRISTVNQYYEYYLGNDKGRLFRSFRGLVFSKLFRTAILREKGLLFDEGMRIAEDMAFTLDYLAFVDNYAFVPEVGYYYRRDNFNSATHKNIWPSFQQAHDNFIHLYISTLFYIQKNNILPSDSNIRLEQRAQHFFQTIRTMYHDKGIRRRQRIGILIDDSRNGYFELLNYLSVNDRRYNASRLLLNHKFMRFDFIQSIIEWVVTFKEHIKITSVQLKFLKTNR